jgi:signal transduction histidine kinase
MLNQEMDYLKAENETLKNQIAELNAINRITLRLGTSLDFDVFLKELISAIIDFVQCERVLILISDEQNALLEYGLCNFQMNTHEKQFRLENIRLHIYEPDEHSIVQSWLHGETVLVQNNDRQNHPSFVTLIDSVESTDFLSKPLIYGNQLIGVVIIDNQVSGQPIRQEQKTALDILTQNAALPFQNARLHHKTVQELADNMREMYIMRQIDKELNDTIDLNHVFEMTLDWALRFTNAQASSLALFDQDQGELTFLFEYGYDMPSEQMALVRKENGSGITERVARSGYAEVVPDVSMDPGFVRFKNTTHSQMAVPVMREDRVIAVITLDSKKLNGFTDAHLDFVQKLATRAGVAIDNARLYEEAIREREKLSQILNNTADIVIVIGPDDRIILINQSALGALQLYANEDYTKRLVVEVFEDNPLLRSFQQAKLLGDNYTTEIVMPSGRVFHANMHSFEGIGWIVVLHDITPFKEMDRLKSELIATVSHDLKQPLSVMNGYIELMLMQQVVTAQGMNAIHMIRRAMQNMRQLIDDLLDLAKIESGITLDLEPVQISQTIYECLDQIRPFAQNKSIDLINQVSADLPNVLADHARLHQILSNLISNAIKYTAPNGWAKIMAEQRNNSIRISIQDNGMGISPEDQIHVFERFYRVRRPETDSIEGTGLGLAIVRSLVELHNGQIGVESKLGEGSTFFVILPVAEPGSNSPDSDMIHKSG